MNENPITEALSRRKDAIYYSLCNSLSTQFPTHFILETESRYFHVGEFCKAGKCTMKTSEALITEKDYHWIPNDGPHHYCYNGAYDIEWNGAKLHMVQISVRGNHCVDRRQYLLAVSRKVAEEFFDAVCQWTAEAHDEVFVFTEGHWSKDAELFQSIKNATLDNLILAGSLKEEMVSDFRTFFDHKTEYEKHNIPWKRGVLFLGPPGNGKTHMVKGLVNALGITCLYVRSFTAEYRSTQSCISDVFERARNSAPCILVLEDLDSLVDETNRSFFLNEMDGFYSNAGILTLATANHPERLDPAILDRPSRFDRKYAFALPQLEERVGYIAMVNDGLEEALRLDADEIGHVAKATEGFSFAYLKELFLSSMMAWVTKKDEKTMSAIVLGQVSALLAQMTTELASEPNMSGFGKRPRQYPDFRKILEQQKGRF